VEAGLRSFNRKMPEEINRILTDHVSDLLFCPSSISQTNLLNEGIKKGVYHTGDVMYDATLYAIQYSDNNSNILKTLNIQENKYVVVTVHRAENTDNLDRLKTIFDYIMNAVRDKKIVFPVHPRTKKLLIEQSIDLKHCILCEPLGYFDMQKLIQGADIVFTDSGGMQKEAYFHQIPCVTLREETEWIETIQAGWNRLWTNNDYAKPRIQIKEYGDGHAANMMVKLISNFIQDRND
jgi:UDP-GlcNAc3NAcA epimerase